MVFKQMASHQIKVRVVRKFESADAGLTNTGDTVDVERWKRKDYGTQSIKKLLDSKSENSS
jgi:hypothetical protein